MRHFITSNSNRRCGYLRGEVHGETTMTPPTVEELRRLAHYHAENVRLKLGQPSAIRFQDLRAAALTRWADQLEAARKKRKARK